VKLVALGRKGWEATDDDDPSSFAILVPSATTTTTTSPLFLYYRLVLILVLELDLEHTYLFRRMMKTFHLNEFLSIYYY